MKALAGACLAAALALPAAAQAGTVRLEDHFDDRSSTTTQEAVYDARPGEANRLDVIFLSGAFGLTDPAGITPGRGCTRAPARPTDPTRAVCPVTADGAEGIAANLGDGNDYARLVATGGELHGDEGDDELIGGDLSTTFFGGAGSDTMSGGADRDFFREGTSPKGPDRISGGGGEDAVDYEERRRKVRADLDGRADDGEAGERDRIGDDVENLIGGRAGDRLTGNRVQNTLIGSGGSDLIKGAGGDDQLYAGGEFGTRSRTRDRLYGGSERDVLNGSPGPNRLSGGPGPDVIYGEGGSDRIRERDNRIDRIECGRGRDRASLDGFDFFADRCERVRRTFLPAGVPLSLDVSGRTVLVEVGCPRDAPRACRGRVLLERGGRRLGSRRFRVRRARTKDISIGVPESAVEARTLVAIVRSLDALGRTRIIRARLDLPAP